MSLSLYQTCTAAQAVAAFRARAEPTYWCDGQFAVFPRTTLCFATMGDPKTGTRMMAPSVVAWKPARLDYRPDDRMLPWFPRPLLKCVQRNGEYVPLHQMFLRPAGGRKFVYAGVARLPTVGDIQDGDRSPRMARYFLDEPLPRDLWLRLGGYAGRLVTLNGTPRTFTENAGAEFEQYLADIPTTPGFWGVRITGYEEHWFTAYFNARRAWLLFVPQAERRIMKLKFDCTAWAVHDPGCRTPRKREAFGSDGHMDVFHPAGETVPREQGMKALIEHFHTGTRPACVEWREAPLWPSVAATRNPGRAGN